MKRRKEKTEPKQLLVKEAGRWRRDWLWKVKFWPLHCCRRLLGDSYKNLPSKMSEVCFPFADFHFSLHLHGSVLVVPFCTLGRFYFEKPKPKETAICLIWSHRAGHAGFSTGCALGHKSWGNSLIPHKSPTANSIPGIVFPNQLPVSTILILKTGSILAYKCSPSRSMEGQATE